MPFRVPSQANSEAKRIQQRSSIVLPSPEPLLRTRHRVRAPRDISDATDQRMIRCT
jgi:hypothetical protein